MQVVRYKDGKKTFEIGCKVGTALKFRKGELGFSNVLESDEIWKNLHKGERANAEELKETFGTDNVMEIAQIIAEKGDLQLTEAERKAMLEEKKNEIVNYIHKYYVDPRSKNPHPVSRIEAAMAELKIHIDPDVSSEKQINDIVKRLPEVLPIKKSEMSGIVSVSHELSASVQGVLNKLQDLQVKAVRHTDENATFEISMVPGTYDKLVSTLEKTTKGLYDLRLEGMPASTAAAPEKEKVKKGGRGQGRGGAENSTGGGGGGGRGRGRKN